MADIKNVSYGKPKVGGAVFSAPTGTELPTDATTTLNESYVGLGYINEEGITNENSPESDVIKAWGGDPVLVVQTDKQDTFNYTLIEVLNINVLKEIYGAENVTGTLADGITIKANTKDLEAHVIVIEMLLQGAIKRIVIPNGKVVEVGEIEYGDEDAIGYATKIQAMPDVVGNTHYEYIKEIK